MQKIITPLKKNESVEEYFKRQQTETIKQENDIYIKYFEKERLKKIIDEKLSFTHVITIKKWLSVYK